MLYSHLFLSLPNVLTLSRFQQIPESISTILHASLCALFSVELLLCSQSTVLTIVVHIVNNDVLLYVSSVVLLK
jgi:hypothetical protein